MRIFIFIIALMIAMPAMAQDKAKESAYDRVIRTGVLKVGYFVWPPYQIQDPNTGELSGFTIDYMKVIASLLDVKVEYVPMAALGTQVEEFSKGRIDVAATDGPYVFTMLKFVDFSDPLFYAPVYAYGRVGESRFKTLQDLNAEGVTFVGLDGDLSADLVRRNYPKAKLTTLPVGTDPGQMMMNVQTSKADAVIIDPGSVITFNANNELDLSIIAPGTPVAMYPIGFSMAKDDGKLLTVMNGVVAALLNTNSMEPFVEKWFPESGTIYLPRRPYEANP